MSLLPQIVVAMIISAVTSIATKLLASDPESNLSEGLRANTREPSAKIPIVYGEIRVGGNDIFIEATGEANRHLWVVTTLSEGECDSIAQVDGADQVWLSDELESVFEDSLEYFFHGGSPSQTVDTDIQAAISKWTDNLRYTCYIIWHLTYDAAKYQNMPQRNVLLRGRKLYDLRTETTAWSNNPVLALFDFMRSDRYGYGFDSDRFDYSSWKATADYCDLKGWTINMRVAKDIQGWDVVSKIMALFRGELNWHEGKIYLRYADIQYEAAATPLDDKQIVQGPDGAVQLSISQPGAFDGGEGLRVSFLDAEKEFIEDILAIGSEVGKVDEVFLDGCTDRGLASKLGTSMLERKQLDRTISGTFRDEAVKMEPGDLVELTCTAFGLSAQLMRIIGADIHDDGLIDLVMQYESANLYDDDYNLSLEGTYTCDLPDKTQEPPTIENVTVTETQYAYRLRTFSRLDITFDEPSNYPWFDHVEIWVSHDGSTWKHQFNSTDDFSIDNIEDGEDYYIRVKVVSIHGVKQLDENDWRVHHLVIGASGHPDSITALFAVVMPNGVNLWAVALTDPDIEHYEFRLGAAWPGSIFLAALRAPNLSLPGVKPGTHTFWCNTFAANGLYGTSPQSASVSLIDPPDGWAVVSSVTCDYNESSDEHSNTERFTYSGDDYLKCSHGSAGLTGTYLSPIYDLGSSARYMCYVIADILMTGDGTTWDDVIPDNSIVATTWDDLGADTRTWVEIFELYAASQVKMTLHYGETSGLGSEVGMQEILSCIVVARYFRVEIEIADPSSAINAIVENFELKFCQ